MTKVFLLCCAFISFARVGFGQTNNQTKTDCVIKARRLQKQLQLTDVQTNKIAEIFTASFDKFERIQSANHGNTDKMMAAMAPLKRETIKKIAMVLTPAQAVKFDKIVSQVDSLGNGDRWSMQGNPAVSN
jgi:protein CpxP